MRPGAQRLLYSTLGGEDNGLLHMSHVSSRLGLGLGSAIAARSTSGHVGLPHVGGKTCSAVQAVISMRVEAIASIRKGARD
jgi:hypothetical protein